MVTDRKRLIGHHKKKSNLAVNKLAVKKKTKNTPLWRAVDKIIKKNV